MATRERSGGPSGPGAEVESLAVVEPPAPAAAPPKEASRVALAASARTLVEFETLLAQLPKAGLGERTPLAGSLNDVLVAMRRPGNEQAKALLVRDALERKELQGLTDDRNRSCRKEAVETLLACGYPWALEVRPEDLAFARGWRPAAEADAEFELSDKNDTWSAKMRRDRSAAWKAMAAAVAFQTVLVGLQGKLLKGGSLFATLLGAAATAVLWELSRRHPRKFGLGSWFAACLGLSVVLLWGMAFVGPVGLVTPTMMMMLSAVSTGESVDPKE